MGLAGSSLRLASRLRQAGTTRRDRVDSKTGFDTKKAKPIPVDEGANPIDLGASFRNTGCVAPGCTPPGARVDEARLTKARQSAAQQLTRLTTARQLLTTAQQLVLTVGSGGRTTGTGGRDDGAGSGSSYTYSEPEEEEHANPDPAGDRGGRDGAGPPGGGGGRPPGDPEPPSGGGIHGTARLPKCCACNRQGPETNPVAAPVPEPKRSADDRGRSRSVRSTVPAHSSAPGLARGPVRSSEKPRTPERPPAHAEPRRRRRRHHSGRRDHHREDHREDHREGRPGAEDRRREPRGPTHGAAARPANGAGGTRPKPTKKSGWNVPCPAVAGLLAV